LVLELHRLSREHPRFGYRRMTWLLKENGWKINRKRVQRLWRQEGLKVPRRTRKRRRLGHSENAAHRRRATHINEVWSYDFIFDRTADGKVLKWLPVVDEFSRENLALEVGRTKTSGDLIRTLTTLVRQRGAPAFIRSDNGSEFIANKVREWIAQKGFQTLYIAPGCPWENPYSETFNSKLRDELLNVEEFGSLAEAKFLAKEFQNKYNTLRPHSALGGKTPDRFARHCLVPLRPTACAPVHAGNVPMNN
jgi:transposase InsO family protein